MIYRLILFSICALLCGVGAGGGQALSRSGQAAPATVLDIGALKASWDRPSIVATTGYHEPNSVGASLYRWAPDDITPADDCTVVMPLAGPPGRYFLNYSGILDARACGARFDGRSDDTIALSRWLNAVLINRIPEALLPVGVALITAPLPTINKPGVILRSAGTGGLHDVGPTTGATTTIRYVGKPGATMLTVAPDNDAKGQALTGNKIMGIVFDANGLAAKGVLWQSVRWGDLDISVHNATVSGLEFGVVSELGEARDAQFSRVRFVGRQVDGSGASGIALILSGDEQANTSLNLFEMIDIQHLDAPAIRSENADSNIWTMVRTFRGATGKAEMSIEWRGGPTEARSTRAETFFKLSTNRPAIARGTPTDKFSARRIAVHLDYENGTPNPIVEPGARVDGIWLTASPNPSGGNGFKGTSTLRYMLNGKLAYFDATVAVARAGSGAPAISVPLPFVTGSQAPTNCTSSGMNLGTGASVQGLISQKRSSVLQITRYDGMFPANDGQTLSISGHCEVPNP